ncbi:MAG: hypothetical protein RMX35_01840 [Nostoc sp. DcaGUA01]|nr:hypothetical protein [Nostoc sp. DcaGUA01]
MDNSSWNNQLFKKLWRYLEHYSHLLKENASQQILRKADFSADRRRINNGNQ